MSNPVAVEARVRILLAEDSPIQAKQVRHTLERSGYQVVVAENGVQALELLRERKPALVISDVMMPEMDGYELCRRIKAEESLRRIPVILLTSLTRTQDVLRGLECGADNFIAKPFETRHIRSRILPLLETKPREEEAERKTLDFLVSAYQTAMERNEELQRTEIELQDLNAELDRKVKERTAELEAEFRVRALTEEEVRRSFMVQTAISKILTFTLEEKPLD